MASATVPQTAPFTPLSDRMQRFARASWTRGAETPAGPRMRNFLGAFFDRYERRPFWERYARSMAFALEQEPIYLLDDERLVGMLYQTGGTARQSDLAGDPRWIPFDAMKQAVARQQAELEPGTIRGGAPGHIGWRWDWILQRGVEGQIALIREHLDRATDVKAKRLYKGALIGWRAVLRWNDRHVAALRKRAAETSGAERDRHERLIAICERVPRRPARTFHEAVQSFHMQHLAVMFENPYGGNGPGRLDFFLWPYLERDLAERRTTLAEAKELVDELFLRFHERLHHTDGWVEGVTLGGTGADGRPTDNPLSRLMIHSIGALSITHPSVYVRVGRGASDEFVDLVVQYLQHGGNRAQIYNDDAVLTAIEASGTSADDAAMYMAGGCMEPSVQGMASDMNFSTTHNVAKVLERVLLDEPGLTRCAGFEDVYATFEAALQREYADMVRALDIASECYARYRPCCMLSSLVGDCLERGREQQDGGARYHEYGFAPLGITSAADSLTALERAVFDERFASAEDMLAAVRADFVGYEALQARLRRLPKYGMEDAEADAMCNRVMRSVCRAATTPRNRFGGALKPMIFNFTWTPGASRVLGARCDGSKAGEWIGHGATPTRAGMAKGVTAAINSCTSLDYDVVSGGATTMWDMDHRWVTFERLKALLKAFLAGGGMIFQGNMTDVKEMEEALEHPDRYPHLIVRVGGYSARFVTLDPALQEEVVKRHRHAK